MLIVGTVPGSLTVGQILLREMLACVDPDRYVIAALVDPCSGDTRAAEYVCPIRIFSPPIEPARQIFGGRFGGLYSALVRLLRYEPKTKQIVSQIVTYAEENGVERIWTILNTPMVIDVSARLVARTRLPLLAQVWDDVEHLTRQLGLDAWTRRRTRKRFARILGSAERIAVIGEAMGAHYKKCLGAQCQIVRYGISDATSPRDQPTSPDEFVIGFSGGMYCPSAWKALLAALTRLEWRAAGKQIRFVVLTGHISFPIRSSARIDYLGWRSRPEVHFWLSKCDLLYLPQPFEISQRALAELSFPTKLSSYACTGRPVMLHGPEYASLVSYAREHPVGLVCTSLDPEVIAQDITTFVLDTGAYRDAARSVANIANTELSRSNFIAQVQAFLRNGSSCTALY